MIIRKSDMGNGTFLALEVCEQGNYLIQAGGARNELGEYRFAEFTRTRSGVSSPKTRAVLSALRKHFVLCGKEDDRGVISYETEGGRIQMMQDADGDEYVRTIGLGIDSEMRVIRLTPQNTSTAVRELFIDLFAAMTEDREKYPQ